jgi:hypothetical protein
MTAILDAHRPREREGGRFLEFDRQRIYFLNKEIQRISEEAEGDRPVYGLYGGRTRERDVFLVRRRLSTGEQIMSYSAPAGGKTKTAIFPGTTTLVRIYDSYRRTELTGGEREHAERMLNRAGITNSLMEARLLE